MEIPRLRCARLSTSAPGFVGVALIAVSRDDLGHRLVGGTGAVVLSLATLLWAFGSVFSRHARQPASPLLAIGMQMIAGGTALLLTGTLIIGAVVLIILRKPPAGK